MKPITQADAPAEDIQIVKEQPAESPLMSMTLQHEGVPLEVIQYFGVDINKMDKHMQGQLREIVNLITPDRSLPMKQVMQQLRALDMKLGQHGFGEARHQRIWSHLKVGRRIQTFPSMSR